MKQDKVFAKIHMRKLIYTLIFIISIFIVNICVCQAKIPIIRVGIFMNCNDVHLKSDKGFILKEEPSMNTLLTVEGNKEITVSVMSGDITVNNKTYPGIDKIRLTPNSGGLIKVRDKNYRGEIEIINNNSLLNIINIIEIEKYLYGVLKKEISPEWPEEVLKAQAIAARTFALSNIDKYADYGYDLCSTTNSQAYGGVNSEHQATNKAVNDTQGIIVAYEGEPINAVYHSDSGGYTENSEDVWGGYVPYLRSVQSEFELTVSPPNHQWSYVLTEEDILEKLAKNNYELKSVKDIVIGEKTDAGRVISVDLCDNNQQIITLKTNDFRLLVGPTMVRSSLFTIEKIGETIKIEENEGKDKNYNLEQLEQEITDKEKEMTVSSILREERDFSIQELISLLKRSQEEKELKTPVKKENIEINQQVNISYNISGKGSGHGVGLSQWGAYGMAEQGYTYEEILKYYYQGIDLIKIY